MTIIVVVVIDFIITNTIISNATNYSARQNVMRFLFISDHFNDYSEKSDVQLHDEKHHVMHEHGTRKKCFSHFQMDS